MLFVPNRDTTGTVPQIPGLLATMDFNARIGQRDLDSYLW